MSANIRTETISYLKKNAANLPLGEPLVITQNGVAKYHVESYEDKVKRDEAIALLKFVALAKSDIAKGNVSSMGSLRDKLALRRTLIAKEGNNDGNSM
jgi:hypothetical protein